MEDEPKPNILQAVTGEGIPVVEEKAPAPAPPPPPELNWMQLVIAILEALIAQQGNRAETEQLLADLKSKSVS